MRKPTLMDVAEAAGVSYATADRVLNNRGGVAQKSVLRVTNAIDQLGYKRDVTAANLARGRSYDFVFLIPSHAGAFFDELRASVEREAQLRAHERITISLEEIRAFDTDHIVQALDACMTREISGVCLVAVNCPRVRIAVQNLRAKGVVVLTLVADIQADSRDAYIGLDNVAAGRTAGRLMALSHRQGGVVLPIAGILNAVDHADRYKGFLDVIPQTVTVLPVVQTFDAPNSVEAAVRSAMTTHPGLSGIYSIGAGHSGLFAALSLFPKIRPTVIIHDLVDHVRTALTVGLIDAVIDQKPDHQVTLALGAMKSLSDGDPLPTGFGTIVPSLYLQDNLPPAPAYGPTESTPL
jgi:LacI family transcriptional regulator